MIYHDPSTGFNETAFAVERFYQLLGNENDGRVLQLLHLAIAQQGRTYKYAGPLAFQSQH